MSGKETTERLLLLEALIQLWIQETNSNVLEDRSELERVIAWQVLALGGAYEQHYANMKSLRAGEHIDTKGDGLDPSPNGGKT